MNTKMIDVAGLSFSYGRKKSKVLDNFSMSLDKGSCIICFSVLVD